MMDDEMDLGEDQDYGTDNDDFVCAGCGRGGEDDDGCPMCCPSEQFAPGTEECDFCEYYDECCEGNNCL